MHVWDSNIACLNARLSVETNSFTNPIVCTENSQDTNFPPIVRINCSIIWSNNFLLAVTTDFPLWESSYSKCHWRFHWTQVSLKILLHVISPKILLHNIALKILLHSIALKFHICLWRITQDWPLPLFTGHQTDFLPHANAQKVCPRLLSR